MRAFPANQGAVSGRRARQIAARCGQLRHFQDPNRPVVGMNLEYR
jgi:hypothetical protein